jgi:hypothetical protein
MDFDPVSCSRSSSVQLLLLLLQTRLPSGMVQADVLVALELVYFDFPKQLRKRGFVHARDDATMPMPGSTVDQIDTRAL